MKYTEQIHYFQKKEDGLVTTLRGFYTGFGTDPRDPGRPRFEESVDFLVTTHADTRDIQTLIDSLNVYHIPKPLLNSEDLPDQELGLQGSSDSESGKVTHTSDTDMWLPANTPEQQLGIVPFPEIDADWVAGLRGVDHTFRTKKGAQHGFKWEIMGPYKPDADTLAAWKSLPVKWVSPKTGWGVQDTRGAAECLLALGFVPTTQNSSESLRGALVDAEARYDELIDTTTYAITHTFTGGITLSTRALKAGVAVDEAGAVQDWCNRYQTPLHMAKTILRLALTSKI